MKNLLVHPCYFGPISQFVALANAENVLFENEDNFQKQTYRNRMYIYGANGKLALTVPIRHTGNKSQHQKYREVQIENDFPWQAQHWKSLQTCYRTSPFFEFYEDDFQPLFEKPYNYLIDFNYDCLAVALDSLQLDLEINKTDEYLKHAPESILDARSLVNAKTKTDFGLDPYTQVFDSKFGYLPNLCILDLIFNEGPNALHYLENQDLRIL